VDAGVDPTEAAEQMRDATERLREQGWMVAPITNAPPIPDPAGVSPEPAEDETPA
jgi:hypothetical protein